MFADLHASHGVDFRFDASLTGIRTDGGRASGVTLGDGTVIEADAVLVAVGVSPNSQLAEDAGLAVDNGIVLDSALRTQRSRTSSPPGTWPTRCIRSTAPTIRVEHWANALNQPAAVAAAMLGQPAQL